MLIRLDIILFKRLFLGGKSSARLERVMVFIARWSSRVFYVIYGGVILLLVWQGDVRIVPFLVGPAMGLIVGRMLRRVWIRERPFVALKLKSLIVHEEDSSFPSMHAVSAFVIGMSIWYLNGAFGSGVLVLAGVTGLSRVMVGVHYPLDILTGAVLGTLISVGVFNYASLYMVISTALLRLPLL